MKNIVITGGSGFIGSHLIKHLETQGFSVTSISLKREIPQSIAECDAIIHLAGAPIFHRWTKRYKQEILDSRIKTAEMLYQFFAKQTKRPSLFISASAVGFYGDRKEETLEETAHSGTDFLSSVCIEWESQAKRFAALGMRTVSIRTATVLGAQGGALKKLLPLFQWGLGAQLGSGRQFFPWIHIEDLVRIYQEAICNPNVQGPVNAAAPTPIRNCDFTKALAQALKKPAIWKIPACVLKILLGEFSSALLSSQKVIPRKLEEQNFCFHYPTIQQALCSLDLFRNSLCLGK